MKDIKLNPNRDYILEGDGVWITVKNISVHIIKTDEGVVADLWALGDEDGEPLTSTWLMFAEAELEDD